MTLRYFFLIVVFSYCIHASAQPPAGSNVVASTADPLLMEQLNKLFAAAQDSDLVTIRNKENSKASITLLNWTDTQIDSYDADPLSPYSHSGTIFSMRYWGKTLEELNKEAARMREAITSTGLMGKPMLVKDDEGRKVQDWYFTKKITRRDGSVAELQLVVSDMTAESFDFGARAVLVWASTNRRRNFKPKQPEPVAPIVDDTGWPVYLKDNKNDSLIVQQLKKIIRAAESRTLDSIARGNNAWVTLKNWGSEIQRLSKGSMFSNSGTFLVVSAWGKDYRTLEKLFSEMEGAITATKLMGIPKKYYDSGDKQFHAEYEKEFTSPRGKTYTVTMSMTMTNEDLYKTGFEKTTIFISSSKEKNTPLVTDKKPKPDPDVWPGYSPEIYKSYQRALDRLLPVEEKVKRLSAQVIADQKKSKVNGIGAGVRARDYRHALNELADAYRQVLADFRGKIPSKEIAIIEVNLKSVEASLKGDSGDEDDE